MAKQQGIRNQITKYQTDKKLIEFMDYLVLADIDNYAKIHSTGGDGKFPSRIQLTMLDYSNGTGDKTVEVSCNLSPKDCKYFYNVVTRHPKDFSYKVEKINKHKVENGVSPVTKFSFIRQNEYNGQIKTYPWTIKIEEGTGVADTTTTGGTKIKANSYKMTKSAYIFLNDEDMERQLQAVVDFINLWEMAYGINLIRKGEEKLAQKYNGENK